MRDMVRECASPGEGGLARPKVEDDGPTSGLVGGLSAFSRSAWDELGWSWGGTAALFWSAGEGLGWSSGDKLVFPNH